MAPTRTTLMPLWKQGVTGGGTPPIVTTWLLRDSYSTEDLAPVANPLTADPGPGLSTVVDTEQKFSIAGGWLVCAGGKAAPAYGDPGTWLGADVGGTPAAHTMDSGYAAYHSLTINALGKYSQLGIDSNDSGVLVQPLFNIDAANTVGVIAGGVNTPILPYTAGSLWKLIQVQRSNTHGYHFISNGNLIWAADDVVGADPAFVGHTNYNLQYSAHDTGLVDLTAQGFTNDFLDVTDTKTNPASATAVLSNADCHINFTFTSESGKYAGCHFRYKDSDEYLYWIANGGNLELYENIGAGDVSLASVVSVFSDGVAYDVDVVAYGSSVKVFVDKVEKIDVTETSHLTETGGTVFHNLVTNDIVYTSHPNPALGIATDRVLCPQSNDTYTHTNDILCVVKDVVLPTANSLDFQFRISGSDEVTLQLASDGSLLLLDNAVTEISAGAATVSDGDDVVVVLDGADGEVFVAGTSVGTTSTIAITTGTAGKRSDSTDADCDYIALFPRSLTSVLPPVLYDDTTTGDGPTDPWPGTFWNWEDDSIGDATPTGVLNQIDATFTVRDDSGATKYVKLIPTGFDAANYGYSHVISYNPAGASTQSFDLDLPSTISSGTHRFEILIGNVTASASQNTFGIRIQDGYRNDTADDAVLCLLDFNTGTERGRILEYTGLQGGFASTTLLDTNTVGTYNAQNDFIDWTLCQYEINIDTGSVTYRIRNVGPNDAADTGWLTDDGTKFDNGPFSVLTVEPRNYSGNTASVAQVWYGLGSYAWPNGILNGWGS